MESTLDIKKLLSDLLNVYGHSGNEKKAGETAAQYLSKYAKTSTDAMGNIYATLGDKNSQRHLLIDAHLDQIGMIVTGITDDGFILFDKVGGVDRRVMLGHEVTVLAKQEEFFGVVCCMPPHLTEAADSKKLPKFDEMSIDIGLTANQAREKISAGDRIALNGKPEFILNNNIISCALDNRASVAAIIYALELIKDKKLNIKITVLLSAQEETGERGAIVGAYSTDATESIAMDVGFAYTPDAKREKCGDVGKGVMIGFAPVLSLSMTNTLLSLVKKEGIDFQYDIMGDLTGTNADMISVSRGGVKSALISVPLKYMHTSVEMVCIDDIISTARLLSAYITAW